MFFSEIRALVRQSTFQMQVNEAQKLARLNGYLCALR